MLNEPIRDYEGAAHIIYVTRRDIGRRHQMEWTAFIVRLVYSPSANDNGEG